MAKYNRNLMVQGIFSGHPPFQQYAITVIVLLPIHLLNLKFCLTG